MQIYIWDLKDPSKPYSPGTRSTKLDEITAVGWNHHVQYALAASSSTGYTVVWDLRGKREVAALAYGGGAGTQAGLQGYGGAGLAVGGLRIARKADLVCQRFSLSGTLGLCAWLAFETRAMDTRKEVRQRSCSGL